MECHGWTHRNGSIADSPTQANLGPQYERCGMLEAILLYMIDLANCLVPAPSDAHPWSHHPSCIDPRCPPSGWRCAGPRRPGDPDLLLPREAAEGGRACRRQAIRAQREPWWVPGRGGVGGLRQGCSNMDDRWRRSTRGGSSNRRTTMPVFVVSVPAGVFDSMGAFMTVQYRG